MRKLLSLIQTLYTKYRNFVLYCVIGVLNTGLDIGVFVLLDKLGVHYILAHVISYHCGIFCSFILNRQKNFKVKDKTLQRFLSFYLSSLVALLLSSGLLYVFVSVCGIPHLVGKLMATAIIVVCQFLFVKNYTFKK